MVVPLPKVNHRSQDDREQNTNNRSYDEESACDVVGNHIVNSPTIVAMCATSRIGASLIEQRERATIENQAGAPISCSQSLAPTTIREDFLGHVAVLTDDGDVHILEFILASADLQGSKARVPVVNTFLSFRTGHLGATCICMHPAGEHVQLCIGHQSGVIASYQVYCSLIHSPKAKRVPDDAGGIPLHGSTIQEGETKRIDATKIGTRHGSHKKQNAPSRRSHARSKSSGFQDILQQLSPPKAAPRVLFPSELPSTADSCSENNVTPFLRTLSEPIAASDVERNESALFGPAQVELCWTGKFDVPIRSICSPGGGWECSSKKGARKDPLLIVGLEYRLCLNATPSVQHHVLSPAISLEAINATLCENYTRTDGPGFNKCISLNECSVWPAPGKEIKDGWTRRAPLRRGSFPFEMLGVQRTSVTNKICESS